MTRPYIAPKRIAALTGDHEAAGLSAPPTPTDEVRHPVADALVVIPLLLLVMTAAAVFGGL